MLIKPIISVILCTYNNQDSLRETLKQLVKQEVKDAGDFEILIIDNNSSDETEATVAEYKGHIFFLLMMMQICQHSGSLNI